MKLKRICSLLSIGLFISFCLLINSADTVYGSEAGGIGKNFYLADYFLLNQGDVWYYKVTEDDGKEGTGEIMIDGTEIVDGVETIKMYELRTSWDGSVAWNSCVLFAFTPEGLAGYKAYGLDENLEVVETVFFNPPDVWVPIRLRNEETFNSSTLNTEYNSESADPDSFDEVMIAGRTLQLKGLEDVTVPAGTFKKCLKIKWSQTAFESDGDHEAVKGWWWLAEGVGRVKTVTITSEFHPETKLTDTKITTTELTDYSIGN